MTLHDAIRDASEKLNRAGITNARLDAEVLLSHLLKRGRAWLFTHHLDSLDGRDMKLFAEMILRRERREPLQYIVGNQEFRSLDFIVAPGVLIPRPETELVVETAIKMLEGVPGHPAVIDLCTGSGCIAVSMANENRSAKIFATDKSGRALIIARENARKHGVADRIQFYEGDLFEPLDGLDIRGQVAAITANPPYIRSGDMAGLQQEVRDYEPGVALFAGPRGTEIEERIIGSAPDFLKKNGVLVMEMGIGQAEELASVVESTGAYKKPEILKDLAGIDRVIAAKKR